jgi:hypothetical protein
MATSRGQGAGRRGRSKEQKDEIEKRRAELLERVKKVDLKTLQGLTLRIGGMPAPEAGSFHKYFFKGPEEFVETWSNAMEAPPPDDSQ